MAIHTDCAAFTPMLGKITGFLMVAFLAMSCAPQTGGPSPVATGASSPNSVLIEMSPAGDIMKVTKANGTVIPRQDNPNANLQQNLYGGGGKHYSMQLCMYCVLGDGCWPVC